MTDTTTDTGKPCQRGLLTIDGRCVTVCMTHLGTPLDPACVVAARWPAPPEEDEP